MKPAPGTSGRMHCASCVLVWLGEAKPSDTLAFALLNAADTIDWELLETDQNDGSQTDPLLKHLHEEPWCPCCKIHLSNTDLHDAEFVYSMVDELSKRSWVSRLWVYQEVASALYVEVYSGSHHLPWEYFRTFANPYPDRNTPSDFEIVSKCRQMGFSRFDPCILTWFLMALGHKQCEEAQDRIFSIRSVAGFSHLENLRLDYAISAAELHKRVVLECLREQDKGDGPQSNTFTYINQDAHAGMQLPHTSLLRALAGTFANKAAEGASHPSWVPDFHRFTSRSMAKYYECSWHLGTDYLRCEPPYDNERGWEFKWKGPLEAKIAVKYNPDHRNILQVAGGRLGRVHKVLEHSESLFALHFDKAAFGAHEPDHRVKDAFVAWLSCCLKFCSLYSKPRHTDFKELMYRASLDTGFDADVFKHMMFPREWIGSDNRRVDVPIMKWLTRDFLVPLRQDHWKLLRYYDDFLNLAYIDCKTQTRIGWIPPSAKEGDVVSLFSGCPRPFVLRSQDNGTFRLLGDSWVFRVKDSASLHIPGEEQEWSALS